MDRHRKETRTRVLEAPGTYGVSSAAFREAESAEGHREILKYLPPVLREVPELRTVMEAEQPELDALWTAYINVLNNQFLLTAAEYGVRRWEMILKLYPKDTDGLAQRRARVLSILRLRLPYSMRWLIRWLDGLFGPDGYTVELTKYTLRVLIDRQFMNLYDTALATLRATVPDNIYLLVSQRYNRHHDLTPFTHVRLAQKTHAQLREEAPLNL